MNKLIHWTVASLLMASMSTAYGGNAFGNDKMSDLGGDPKSNDCPRDPGAGDGESSGMGPTPSTDQDSDGNPINIISGNKFHVEPIYRGYGYNPINYTMYYNSGHKQVADYNGSPVEKRFGKWTASYSQRIIFNMYARDNKVGTSGYYVFREDGQVLRFKSSWSGNSLTLTSEEGLKHSGQLTYDTVSEVFTYKRVDGAVESYDKYGFLTKIAFPNGVEHTVADDLSVSQKSAQVSVYSHWSICTGFDLTPDSENDVWILSCGENQVTSEPVGNYCAKFKGGVQGDLLCTSPTACTRSGTTIVSSQNSGGTGNGVTPATVTYRNCHTWGVDQNAVNAAITQQENEEFIKYLDYNYSVTVTHSNGDSITFERTGATNGDNNVYCQGCADTLSVAGSTVEAYNLTYNADKMLSQIEYVHEGNATRQFKYKVDEEVGGAACNDYSPALAESCNSQLTGIIDKEGIRFQSWDYDNIGRAYLSYHGEDDGATLTEASNLYDFVKINHPALNANGTPVNSGHNIKVTHSRFGQNDNGTIKPLGPYYEKDYYIDNFASPKVGTYVKSITSTDKVSNPHCQDRTRQYTLTNGRISSVDYDNDPSVLDYQYTYYTDGRIKTITQGGGSTDAITVEYTWLNSQTGFADASQRKLHQMEYKDNSGDLFRRVVFAWSNTHDFLVSKTITDLTNWTSPYATNGRSLVWQYGYTFHDAGNKQIATMTITPPSSVQVANPSNIDNIKTVYTYTTQGVLLSVKLPTPSNGSAPLVVAFSQFNSKKMPERVIDQNGVAYDIEYDDAWRLKSLTSINLGVGASYQQWSKQKVSYDYYANGLLKTMVTPNGNQYLYEYDKGRRLIRITDTTGSEYKLNKRGVQASSAYSLYELIKNNTVYKKVYEGHDSMSDLTQYTVNTSSIFDRTIRYDGKGLASKSIDQFGQGSEVEARDGLNRVKTVKDLPASSGANGEVIYTYHPTGQISEVKTRKASGEYVTTTYTVDGFGRVIRRVSPDSGTTDYFYGEDGRVWKKEHAGEVSYYKYDELGRLVSSYADTWGMAKDSKYHSGNYSALFFQYKHGYFFQYDTVADNQYGKGRMTVAEESLDVNRASAVKHEYFYDYLGNIHRKVEEHLKIGSAQNQKYTYQWDYTYNKDGAVTSIKYPSGRTVYYERASDNSLISVKSTTWNTDTPEVLMKEISYGPFATPLLAYKTGADIQVDRVVNKGTGSLWLPKTEVKTSATPSVNLIDRDIGFNIDGSGNIASITDALNSSATESFTYVGGKRLESAQGIYGNIDYTYDNNGNMTQKTTVLNGQTTVASYPTVANSNRLMNSITVGGVSYSVTYDNKGNMTLHGLHGATYTYDRYNRISQATVNGVVTDYYYDHNNLRALEHRGSETTSYLYGLNSELLAVMRDGKMLTEYVYADGLLIAQYTADPTADADGDGVDDDWENLFFYNTNISDYSAQDTDNDGISDYQEYLTGRNPKLHNGTAGAAWDDRDDVLDDWEKQLGGSGSAHNFSDFDGDGELDIVQAALEVDTDGDGLRDPWELQYFPLLITTDGATDSDGDGSTNLQEQTYMTNPTVFTADADNDGNSDLWEVQHFTTIDTYTGADDPDNDNRTNAQEEQDGTDPNKANFAWLVPVMMLIIH